jgi:hypothetical protein
MPPELLLRMRLPLLPLFRSSDDPMPRSLELDVEPELESEPELLRLSDELRSENIARSLLVPRSPDDDSRFRMLSLLPEELELLLREPSACSISDERFGPPCLSVRFLFMRDMSS